MEQQPAQVFYSYAHDDKSLVGSLNEHLSLLQRENIISTWCDLAIEPGEEWEESIANSLELADLILLVISASFLASDFCWGVELKRAMQRHDEGSTRLFQSLYVLVIGKPHLLVSFKPYLLTVYQSRSGMIKMWHGLR